MSLIYLVLARSIDQRFLILESCGHVLIEIIDSGVK